MERKIPYKFFVIILLCFFFPMLGVRAEEILTWQECLSEAAKNHPDLVSAEENVKESQAGKKVIASTLFPQVKSNLSASTSRTDTGTSDTTTDTYAYGVTGTQLLFDAGKTFNDVRAASENINAAIQNFRFISSTVRFRLRSAFINLLKAQELLDIAEQIFDIRRGSYELITLKYESGLEHKGALLTAEANLAEAGYEISQTKRNSEVLQREMVKEMGREQLTPIKVKGDFVVRDAAREKPDLEALIKNNPSLMQIAAQKDAAQFNLRSAYLNFYPTLSGQAGANKSSSRWLPKNDQWNLGLTLSIPIFEGGLKLAQVSQAQALLNQLKADERSARDEAVLKLEQTWAALQDALGNLDVQKKSLTAAEERSKIAQAQYSTGFLSFDNWIIIEDNLVNSKRTFLDAKAAALLSEADWIQAEGETLEYAE